MEKKMFNSSPGNNLPCIECDRKYVNFIYLKTHTGVFYYFNKMPLVQFYKL